MSPRLSRVFCSSTRPGRAVRTPPGFGLRPVLWRFRSTQCRSKQAGHKEVRPETPIFDILDLENLFRARDPFARDPFDCVAVSQDFRGIEKGNSMCQPIEEKGSIHLAAAFDE